jgi:hypothetical protein
MNKISLRPFRGKPPQCHPEKKHYSNGLCKTCYNREYDSSHPEQAKVGRQRRGKRWRSKPENKASIEEYNKSYFSNNKPKFRQLNNQWRKINRVGQMLIQARKRAKKKGWVCTLAHQDIVIPKYCPVLGIELRHGIKIRCANSPSLDRIDSSKGYTPDNIAVISEKANRIKNDATLSDILLIADYMLRHAKIGTVNA